MRAGAQPDITPARPHTGHERDETSPSSPSLTVVGSRSDDERAAKVARLELVRPGITTAATMAHERTLPVSAGLQELLPRGALQRGSTVAAHGVGATSFGLAMVAEAVRQGSFLAVVAPRSFGLAACLDFDIPLRRVVQFVLPEQGSSWAQLVAAIVEGFDTVIIADRRRVTASQARQLTARVRERGTVLVRSGGPPWPDAADLRYDLAEPRWQGLGAGHGHLDSRVLRVQVAGRRWHGGDRLRHLALPASGLAASGLAASGLAASGLAAQGSATQGSAGADRAMVVAAPGPIVTADGPRHAGSDIDYLVALERVKNKTNETNETRSTHRPGRASA